ncbi:bifunctional phosphopantothenoylcysteine decarboxylase/phosphopantothenate--cysteine ligase CoaBC [Ectothiorhodospiraceae bacterium BW-2]|nr:bifunctional phosphopantothenoylcysteine decarboxylase/phosphopantothenate--cysteine ligase CoaBC [Ectothiorhodospiraceae bacterium BW-2]
MAQRTILLGVSGGVAAVKIPALIRLLVEEGIGVEAILTHSALQFVTPLSLRSMGAVSVSGPEWESHSPMSHIDQSRRVDAIVLAPTTAHLLARLALGLADDYLTTTLLASLPTTPLLIAPAMNLQMWQAETTQLHVATLKQRGVRFIGPESGVLACGETGAGRMVAPERLVDELLSLLEANAQERPLSNYTVTVTAGPTQEAIDAVRFISNHSSGKMGYAIAAAAQKLGATVRLVSGPVALTPPPRVERVAVTCAEQMYRAVMAQPGDIFIAAAAVADYRVKESSTTKMKKGALTWSLELVPTVDILAKVAALPPPQRPFCVGFAAETDNLLHYAQQKLERKRLDMVAANWVGREEGGFHREMNQLFLIDSSGEVIELPLMAKSQLAQRLLAEVVRKMVLESSRASS